MSATKAFEVGTSSVCAVCGIPVDARFFDSSGTSRMPAPGQQVVLAHFQLQPQYCGMLEYFSQFWDEAAKDPSKIHTEGLEWAILSNGHPLYPYVRFDRIVNPWGYGSFPVMVRLDENATVEFVVRNLNRPVPQEEKERQLIGGRIVGRYWYNAVYGDVVRNHRR